MYQKILVPLDGSIRAEKILSHAEHLALQNESKVLFLRVVRFSIASDGYTTISIEQSIQENQRRINEAVLYLSSIEGEFREKGIGTKKIVENGEVVETIIRVAQRENAALIAMASHGRGGFARVFYGSVAAGVLNSIDRPIFLVRSRSVS
jgi:nucleotide-binding universal stress UspA family protein